MLNFILTFLVSSLLLFISVKKEPKWIENSILETQWKKINFINYFLSLTTSNLVYFLSEKYITEYRILISLSVNILLFIFFQAIFTDLTLRLVDRRLFHSAILILSVPLILFSIKYNTLDEQLTGLCLLILSLLFVLYPIIGPSDGRAFLLTTLIMIPLIGLNLYYITFVGFLVMTIIVGVFLVIKKKTLKISIPAVPLILFPNLFMLIFTVFFIK